MSHRYRKNLSHPLLVVLFLFATVFFTPLAMSEPAQVLSNPIHADVQKLLDSQNPPDGVVFDIETLDKNALQDLAGYVKNQIELLKQKYPEVDIAIVSHGTEEYALQTRQQDSQASLHNTFNRLVSDQGVSIHVCGAVAGLNNLSQDDFPDYVTYSDSGMAQINDYKALGYKVIVIKQLTEQQRKDLFERPEAFIK